ncbi:hypothetical protein GCM10009613_35840 [Pseudonocardia kongjuensis]|uniref:Uncharacterized protein n=1 Tax=Pseudonocardia kongjuensis TaxID=102227 RepID=A0ABN1XWQ3_9PSEU
MGSVGLLILFAIVGALICAKARSAGGAAAFTGLAIVLFIATPLGQGIPDVMSTFMSSFDQASTPVLNRTPAEQASAVGGDR